MLKGSELYGDCTREAYMRGAGVGDWGGTEGLEWVDLGDECHI